MKNKVLASLLAMALMLSLAACGGSPSTASPPPSGLEEAKTSPDGSEPRDPVTITVWVAGSGDPTYDNTYRTVLDAYVAENPHVSYELTFIAWGDYFTKLNTGLAGGAGPDILMLGYGQMGTVQNMGALLELDDYIPDDWDGWDDFLPRVLEVGQNEGKTYGLLMPASRVYFYRKDIAAQNGVTEEDLKVDTYEDLRQLSIKMTVKDAKGNIEMSGNDINTGQTSPEQQFMMFMSYVTDSPALWNADLSPNFNSPDGVKAMQMLVDLYAEGVSLPTQPGVTSTAIVTGGAAMCPGPVDEFTQASLVFPGQIGIVDCSLNSMLSGNFFAVSKTSKNPVESAAMLLHMFSKESCKEFSRGIGLYSGRTSLDEDYVQLNPDEYGKVVKAFKKSIPMGSVMNPYYNKMLALFRTAMEEVYAGAEPNSRFQKAADDYVAAMNE